jgi:hypothetical protein
LAQHRQLVSPFIGGRPITSFPRQVACAKVKTVVVQGQVMDPWKMLRNVSFASHKNKPLLPTGVAKYVSKHCMAHSQETTSDETVQAKLLQAITEDDKERRAVSFYFQM